MMLIIMIIIIMMMMIIIIITITTTTIIIIHLHVSLNRGGRLCTTNDFTTSFLHFSLFSNTL